MTKKIKVKWWSQIPHMEQVMAPQPARKFFPQWYKDIKNPQVTETVYNIKVCPSFPLWFQQGYVVPVWTDIILRYKESTGKCYWETPYSRYKMEFHLNEQLVPYLPDHIKNDIACIFKTDCPWRIMTPEGYSMMQLNMYYEYSPLFETLPGIIPTDIWHQINQQLIIKKSTFRNLGKDCLEKRFLGWRYITITKGSPLAVYVPFKRENYDYEIVPYPKDKELFELDETNMLKIRGKFFKQLPELKDYKPD
tara:strand:- start:916 stop:1665 length:750 start_codon:yes stop_codon:yes gene_type:complete